MITTMITTDISLPTVVTRAEWLVARKQLLAKEKELTRRRDTVNAERRGLPMVRIEKDYVFEGADGKVSLLDLFEDRLQLIIYHFMWLWDAGEPLDKGCPSCSAWPTKSQEATSLICTPAAPPWHSSPGRQ
jgi:predicted dithiol-disulfide oxidoreductase (DUF899 family)